MHDSSDSPYPALDEFAHEDGVGSTGTTTRSAGNIFVFDCETQPPAESTVAGDLLGVTSAPPRQDDRPAALSRSESRAARRRRRRLAPFRRLAAAATAWVDGIGRAGSALRNGVLGGSSALHRGVARVTHRSKAAATASRHAIQRTSTTLGARAWPREGRVIATPATGAALMYPESNGFIVAILLAMTVVSYGGFLMGSWRGPWQPGDLARTAGVQRPLALTATPPAIGAAPSAAPTAVTSARDLTPAVVATTVVPPRATFTPTAKTVTAMWRQRDTRSLDQAFTALRQQTLAFHRCRMRMTETDRAVARCEGVATNRESARPTTWTIDFKRTAGRWVIGAVTTR